MAGDADAGGRRSNWRAIAPAATRRGLTGAGPFEDVANIGAAM